MDETTTLEIPEEQVADTSGVALSAVPIGTNTPYLEQATSKEINPDDGSFSQHFGKSFTAELSYHASKVSNDLNNIINKKPVESDNEGKFTFYANKITELVQADTDAGRGIQRADKYIKAVNKIWNSDETTEISSETYAIDEKNFALFYNTLVTKGKVFSTSDPAKLSLKLRPNEKEFIADYLKDASRKAKLGMDRWGKPRLNSAGNLIKKNIGETKSALIRAEGDVIRSLLDSISRRDKENLRSILIVGAKLNDIKKNQKELFGKDVKLYEKFIKSSCNFSSTNQANKYIRAYLYYDKVKASLKNEEFVGIETINQASEELYQKDMDVQAVSAYITRKLNSAFNAYKSGKEEKLTANGKTFTADVSSLDSKDANSEKEAYIASAIKLYIDYREEAENDVNVKIIENGGQGLIWSKSTAKMLRQKTFELIQKKNDTHNVFLVVESELSPDYKSTEYNPAKSYSAGDKVTFNDSRFECIKDTNGNEPTDGKFWQEIVSESVDDRIWNKIESVKPNAGIDLNALKSSWSTAKQKEEELLNQLTAIKSNIAIIKNARNSISQAIDESGFQADKLDKDSISAVKAILS